MAASSPIGPMVVEDAMHRGVITCRPGASALTVARIMAGHRIHSVLVVDDDGACTGVVSDSELEYALLSGVADPLAHALELMHERATTHVVVFESKSQRPVGVLSILDVAEAVSKGDRP